VIGRLLLGSGVWLALGAAASAQTEGSGVRLGADGGPSRPSASSAPRAPIGGARLRLALARGRLQPALRALGSNRPLGSSASARRRCGLPDYRGSDQSHAYLLPLPYVVYRGRWLRADRDGARALLLESERVKVDLSLAASVPTRSRDNEARRGMPDLAPTLELGPNLNVELLRSPDSRLRLDLRLPLRAAVAVQRSPEVVGLTFSPNLNLDIGNVAGGWALGPSGRPGIRRPQVPRLLLQRRPDPCDRQRAAYQAAGGYGGWRALAATSRRIGTTWVGAFVRYDNLRGAAFEASPLVRRDHQVTVGLGVSWVFASSAQQVWSSD
jgi:hypothetical protein